MPSVKLDNVSVNYNLYLLSRNKLFPSIGQLFSKKPKGSTFVKSALKSVTFEIKERQRVGLIGHNGAGKSTLLRVVSGILKPSNGNAIVDGTIGALFAGLNFVNPNLSPRENLQHFSELNSLTNAQKRLLFEDLEDFTELGEYFDQPLIFGSTGMQARFNFGLLTSSPKDILVVDEGIGAGDQFFQVKAEARLRKLYAKASILVMASHSDDLISKFCNRVIWMEDGEIRKDGKTETVLTSYKDLVNA